MVARNRVLSFMSQFSSNRDSQYQSSNPKNTSKDSSRHEPSRQEPSRAVAAPSTPAQHPQSMNSESQPQTQRERAPSRPMSMVQTYQPPLMDVSQDTLPELQPIFTFLNSHGNKLYQEGYFLKLDDQNTHGRANADRTWTECFAQLVGTVLSLWDAAELDAAGQDGEVLPKFINLADASIKMIESLPTRSDNEAPLQNVLSVSTAGKNRYLLHFNSHHSLIQWTAGIRLSMFEHTTLQEAYTGALIAGKGKGLNNIGVILERARLPSADWARVRFGAGTPWRRCWCVITPPDEKEVQKLQKQMNKKKSAYDRSTQPLLRGDVKFYDTKKTKKVRPIATISDAYSAYAIYPQSKPLIDASTLVKVEGSITIHSNPPSTTEGFVFVMPEVHPAITGFEMMLRWLFPVFDTFGLYGRPTRLIADTSDPRSLMFAMPKQRRYGYLEILDVSGLILEQGSASWRESEWRKRMKELTGKRMTAIENGTRSDSRYGSRRSARNSFGPSRSRIQFDDGASIRSSPSITWGQNSQTDISSSALPRTDSAPPAAGFAPPRAQSNVLHQNHQRSASETVGLNRYQDQDTARYDGPYDQGPAPPPHLTGFAALQPVGHHYQNELASTPERLSSEDEQPSHATPVQELQDLQAPSTPEPVAPPPAFAHPPGSLPASKPYHSPELRRANNRMSTATLTQLAGAGGAAVVAAAALRTSDDRPRTGEDQRRQNNGRYSEERGQRGVMSDANVMELPSNQNGLPEGLTTAQNNLYFPEKSLPAYSSNFDSSTQHSHPPPQFSTNTTSNFISTAQTNNPVAGSPNRTYEPPHSSAPSNSKTHNPGPQEPESYQGPTSKPSTDSAHPPLSRLQLGQSITRKPLPVRTQSIQTPSSAETESSLGSLGQHVIDQSAFDMIGQGNVPSSVHHQNEVHRQNSQVSSVYDDDASTTSPDYASARGSVDTRTSVERPRAGVMRTVGTENQALHHGRQDPSTAIPNIDFGPTINYAPDRRPQKSSSAQAQAQGRQSPGPGMNNFPADRAHGQYNPNSRPGSGGNRSRSPMQNVVPPDTAQRRIDSGASRTLAWQPGMGAVGGSGSSSPSRLSMTAEQFVLQRAAAVKPQYAHQRQSSSVSRENTPPLTRNRSSELLALGHHSRSNSTDLLQRPGSRGAAAALGPSGSGEITSNLSAREQEHLARVTGQPLINMTQNKRASQGTGLVGAIEQREREKVQMKQGINSQAVQHALNQRQQQAVYQQQYSDQLAANYRGSAPQLGGQTVQSPQSQPQWISPAANAYAQGGGWATPSPGYGTPPEHGRQSPSQYPPRQQYFPQSNPGRNSQGFHGHGN